MKPQSESVVNFVMILKTLWETFQALVVVGFIVLFLLARRSGKTPHAFWTQALNIQDRRTEEQKRRARHTSEVIGGLEMIGMGVATPVLYLLSTVFMFNNPNPVILSVSLLICVTLIVFGIRTMVRAGRH